MKIIGFFLGLGAKVKLFLAGLATFALIIAMAVLKGQSMQKVKEAVKDAKEYRKTTERFAAAKPVDNDADNARARLSKRK